ncbi:uncharacterized protein LOC116248290 isoform X2 [Nymphaea colorata]|uniref:uncharacterized protein LOC116248290 isoform X2 n=1 Tax=Nymphaea colorata TaxID=210225 RepID=UPI00214EA45D|nr:uncharacterized protein LOC116248290 isoform X2 [Nymphaea colorata]
MGDNESWAQSDGLLPNGLLPNVAARVTRKLNSERWLKAEERTAELIACIQPNQPSEERRNAVANYVQQLIMKCFSCQVFTFGSVPLKTYLPDGDIDLTAFSKNQHVKDTWANDVRDMLENEEKREDAEFHVKEVQYIQAEVKIIKCLVENIVVDISFNQLGGLCTLCFLEEVDQLINQNHLFKRSIILIKAWCYYESRILGAHHGLISTYALETLVLYIFHVFNNSFTGPLEVLYRFLEFFSNFDWENFCVSLWGPVPISQLPDITADPPRNDGGELLLSKPFLDACSSIYAVYPGVQENQGQPFVSKHFNIIDPLRTNNNLGRSVSKGNFFRIRSAFAFGAKKLARLLECPKDNLIAEVNQFFLNTWERHGGRHRPDAPGPELWQLKPPNMGPSDGSDKLGYHSTTKKKGVNDGLVGIGNVSPSEGAACIHNPSSENTARINSSSGAYHSLSQKNYGTQTVSLDKTQKVLKPNYSLNNQEAQVRHQFARTSSSPELTETSSEASTRGRRGNKAVDIGQNHHVGARPDYSNKRKNMPSEASASCQASSNDLRHSSSQQSLDVSIAPNLSETVSNYAHSDGSGVQEHSHQEEQDLVNMIGAPRAHVFPGPMSLTSSHLPVSLQSSIFGYSQRNLGGMMPMIDPAWGSGMQFPPGLVPPQLSRYFSGLRLASSQEEVIDSSNENSTLTESNQDDSDAAFWHENENASSSGTEFGSSSRFGGSSNNSVRGQPQKLQNIRGNDIHTSDKSASMKSFALNEVNSSKLPKSARDKRGRKGIPGVVPATPDKSKVSWQYENDISLVDEMEKMENKDRHMKSSRDGGPASAVPSSLPVGYEAGSSGSDPMIPGPMLVGSGSRQITFYPTGPPVPFVTMLPLYNFPPDAGSSGGSPRQFDRDDSLENGHANLSEHSATASNFDAPENLEQPEAFGNPSSIDIPAMEPRAELNVDILHSDFISHWQNLQYGRICQSARNHPPIIYSPQLIVPPVYLQGHFPLDGPGRPLSGVNMGLFTQVMGYGPRFVPVTPLQPGSSRPSGIYQYYNEEMPRYRGGTGTYLPNPKPAAFRDRQSANSRSHRGGYNFDKNDQGDSDRGWSVNSKSRGSWRNHNKYEARSQSDKPHSRSERPGGPDSRGDRTWDSYRHEAFTAIRTQNGPSTSTDPVHGTGNIAYSMYPLQAANSNAVGTTLSGTGPSVPSVVMLYPYEHGLGFAQSQEQLEFGSLGPGPFGSVNEATQIRDGGMTPGLYEQRHGLSKGGSPAQSPDQPSSPQVHRSAAQVNYSLKEEDFPLWHSLPREGSVLVATLTAGVPITKPFFLLLTHKAEFGPSACSGYLYIFARVSGHFFFSC